MADEKEPKQKRVEVYWTTVSYRTLLVYGALALGAVLALLYLIYPDAFGAIFRKLTTLDSTKNGPAPPVTSRARFIAYDGKVEVRKADATRWVNADSAMTLDRGDLVQTGNDGVARIVFADGTTYTVKSDTLITVEENSMAQDRSTRVAVSITTGAVDLTTGTFEGQGSKSEVSFADAVASVNQNSRAAVRTDPTKKQHEITVAAGGAEVQRGGERVTLSQWEKVSFPSGGPIVKSRVLAPPELMQPVNAQPIIVPEPRRVPVVFHWKPVSGAVGYVLRVSRTSMFTQIMREQRTSDPSVSLTGLDAGDYFWAVTAVDAQNKSSEPSETRRFLLGAQGRGQEMFLEIEGVQYHGTVVEVMGRTEPGAAVLINGQPVPSSNIGSDGRFRHFTEKLARGSQKITVVAQNRRGGFAKKDIDVVIP